MTYYSRYSFVKNKENPNEFIFSSHFGDDVPGFTPAVYKKGVNKGKGYIRMSVPRSPAMKKYFAYTFELSYNVPLTSTEAFNEKMQTFGDSKKLGTCDLILFEYNKEYERLSLYFLKDLAWNVALKKSYFDRWANGEELTYSPNYRQEPPESDEEEENDEEELDFDPYDEFQDELAEEEFYDKRSCNY